MGHNNLPASSSTPSLAAFIRSYADGPSPACELQYTEQDGSFKVTASNAAFTRELEKDLIDALRSSIQERVIHVNSIRWSLTALESDSESNTSDHPRSKTIVCMGTSTTDKTDEKVIPRDATSQDKPAQEAYSHTRQPRHYSSSTSTSEEWLQQWSKMHVPGFERQALLDHIDLIRKVDWSKTPLGPMDTWSIVLLSTLGQALASAFPVLLAWGPELTQIYNLPYSFNIAQKHPSNMGLSYAEAWPEVWECELPFFPVTGALSRFLIASLYIHNQRTNHIK